jgi:hypothetical protein
MTKTKKMYDTKVYCSSCTKWYDKKGQVLCPLGHRIRNNSRVKMASRDVKRVS